MAAPKKGSRIITVEGVKYRWRIRHKPTYSQGLAQSNLAFSVELAEEPQSVLVVTMPYARPDNWLTQSVQPVLPADVERSIRAALAVGWNPASAGKTFYLDANAV